SEDRVGRHKGRDVPQAPSAESSAFWRRGGGAGHRSAGGGVPSAAPSGRGFPQLGRRGRTAPRRPGASRRPPHRRARLSAPPPEDVPDLVDRACSVIEKGLEYPAISAAWIHVGVAAIHPFPDGNGRAARVVASLAMYRGGFKLAEFTSLEEWW